ncbi:hypothetical protein FQN54_008257 [Arachnomyces sp. PD_36]|nr:hypothetical protein FQN54_008257 [Arachnomyces sp. PD_36]
MPIPTRSLSLREPTRLSQRQVGQNIASPTRENAPAASRLKPRTTSNTGTGTGTTTTTTVGIENGLGRRRTGQFHKPTRSESVSSTSTSSASLGRDRDRDNASPQRRSLLPQKSGFRRESQHIPERSQPQLQSQSQSKPKPQLQQPAQPAQQQESRMRLQRHRNAPSISSHRLSLARSGESSAPSTPTTATHTEAKVGGGLPAQQQKTQMLPPSRLERSASLRQPASSRPGAPGSQTKSHARNRSVQLDGSRFSNQLALKQSESVASTPTASVASTSKSAKPSFNTFQQHYSPKKQPKPPPPTASTPTVQPTDPDSFLTASRPEVAALQTELLQLHLIHSSAVQTQTQWKASAEKQLRQRYKSVAAKYRSAIASDSAVQQNINTKALRELSENAKRNSGGRHDFTEQIRILSRTLQDVADMTDLRGGRYTLVVREFENWVERFNPSGKSQNASLDGTATADFITPIGRNWQTEVSRLNSKLELCLRSLHSIDVTPEGPQKTGGGGDTQPCSLSALWRIVRGHTDLVSSMIDELETIWKIEAEVVRVERERVREAVDSIVLGPGSYGSRNGQRKGVWKTG